MKLLKNRNGSRAAVEPEGRHLGNAPAENRKSRSTSFGLFDTFRKASKTIDEDETCLIKKDSYTHSERTEPTDAMTVTSETVSVASEEICTALNRTFAIFRTPSMSQTQQEARFLRDLPSGDDEGQFTNVAPNSKPLLNQESLDRLAALETATHFSDPKNRQLRTESIKIVEMLADPSRSMDGDAAMSEFEVISAVDAPSRSEATFDPDNYLFEAEARFKESNDPLPPMLGDEDRVEEETSLEEVEVNDEKMQAKSEIKDGQMQYENASTLSMGVRTLSPNTEYISEPSDGEDEEKAVKQEEADSPPHSPAASSSTSESVDWEKGSTGTRSLFDAILNKDHEVEDGSFVDVSDDDGSSLDFTDDELGTDDEGAGTVEGPATPHSQGSSIVLEDYPELDAIAAFSSAFMNLVSCNFADIASSIVIDDEDDFSMGDGEIQPATANIATTAQTQTNRLNSVKERVLTPPATATDMSSFWSFFGTSGCSS